jgi:hypothetical protein
MIATVDVGMTESLIGEQLALLAFGVNAAGSSLQEQGLVGYWKLRGDCRDYSGQGNHGVNHGVKLEDGSFDGIGAYVEVPNSASLRLGRGDFTISAWIFTEKNLDDVVGDVLDMYDPALRRGITLSVNSSASGYQSQGGDRHVYFGIDNARLSDWQDCGRPSAASNYVSNSMTVYGGHLYAAVGNAKYKNDWCHVFRYGGGEKWIDCGRVGDGQTTGVGPLIVHDGELYAVTSTYDWTRVRARDFDGGKVYRYLGGTKWEDCGQPGNNRTINCAASYAGKLFVGGGPLDPSVYTQAGDKQWQLSKAFPTEGPRYCFPHAMSRYNGKLYTAFPCVYSFDGKEWTYCGVPAVTPDLQTHSLQVYQGKLCAGTWAEAKVGVYEGGEDWTDIGRVGEDGTEVNSLLVYNGKLYGGSLPRSEICRYDGDKKWTSLKRFYSPHGWHPGTPPQNYSQEQLNDWSRLTSMTIYGGKLFASTGSCTSSVEDAPCDVRGKVYCVEAGKCVSYDDELTAGWKYLTAVRREGRLELCIDGKLAATSPTFDPAEYDLSNDRPLRIGFGQTDYFSGKISEVQIYSRALSLAEIRDRFSQERPPSGSPVNMTP